MSDQFLWHLVTNVCSASASYLARYYADWIDVLQIHWPVTEPQKKGDRIDPSVKETWAAMEALVDEVSVLVSCDVQFQSSLHS